MHSDCNPLISIIVPVYKVEGYLDKCISSIVQQSYKNLEIILVDDGSPDKCGDICDDWGKKDSRIVVIHKENGGLSDARNAGLGICRGEYVGFVDSDDYIDVNMYGDMLRYAVDNNLDVVMCTAVNVYNNAEEKFSNFIPYCVNHVEDIIVNIFAYPYYGASTIVCNKLFRKPVFNGLQFKKGIAFEDDYICLDWISNTNKMGFLSAPYYKYVQRLDSITNKIVYSDAISDVIKVYRRNKKIIYSNYNQHKKVLEAVDYRMWWAYRYSLDMLLKCSDVDDYMEEVSNIQTVIKNNILKIFNNKYMSKRQKVAYLLICLNLNMYKIIKFNF